jgi:hypothetical protein
MSGVGGAAVKVGSEARVGGGVRVVQADSVIVNKVRKKFFIEDIVTESQRVKQNEREENPRLFILIIPPSSFAIMLSSLLKGSLHYAPSSSTLS